MIRLLVLYKQLQVDHIVLNPRTLSGPEVEQKCLELISARELISANDVTQTSQTCS